MLKYVVAAVAFTTICATPADAQTLPPVETMTCDQMNAEMITAGMQMNSQLDTEGLIAENDAMQEEAERRRREQTSMSLGTGIACSIPGLGAACTAASMAQASRAAEGVDEQHARMDRQIGRVNDFMAGLDQNRLMAMYQRHEQMQCPTPQ